MFKQSESPDSKSATAWKGYALVIAVSKYDNVRGLPSAVLNDANDLASILASAIHCGYPAANIRVLLDHEASLVNIRKALARLALIAGPDDSVVVFFSGHGTQLTGSGSVESALLPVDTELTRLRETSLPEGELSSALKAITSARLLVLLDACHSGGSVSLKGTDAGEFREAGFDEKSLAHLAEGVGRVVIASSRSTETSLVFTGARNSVFTQYLLEAFRGESPTSGDGVVRVFDVFQHVSARVPQATSNQQHPIFKASDLEMNFPVALDKGGRKSVAGTADQHSGADFNWNELEGTLSDLYPTGPTDQDVWRRAGGDLSRLRLNQSGRANWFASLLTLRQGGGGRLLTRASLIRVALDDYPNQQRLNALLSSDE